jgi:hypothetical protein
LFGSAWFRFGLLLAAAGLLTLAITPAVGREPRAYGRQLVVQYQLPPDTIARYAALAAGTALDASPRENSMFADRSPWVGPKQSAGVGRNPYTLVFTVRAAARTAGAAYAQWQAGWEVHESPVASRELLMAVPRTARSGLVAGQALTLTASSSRVSFRGERSVAPMLGLVQMHNLDISAVELQVWSGEAPVAWPELPLSPAALLALGVTFLLVPLGFRFWQHTAHGQGPLLASRRDQPRKGPASAEAIEGVEASPAPEVPALSEPSHEARVIAALHQVLTVGLAVHTVLDEARMRKRAVRSGQP